MIQRSLTGRLLGHLCGIVGATIAIDGLIGRFNETYVRIYPYGDGGFVIAVFLIALGARVVNENLPRKIRGPWQR
jgi:hypothetical protein